MLIKTTITKKYGDRMRNLNFSNKTKSISTKMTLNNSQKLLAGFLALVLVAGMTSPAYAGVPPPPPDPTCSFVAAISVGGTGTCEFVEGIPGELDMFIIEETIDECDARLYYEFDDLIGNQEPYQVKKTINNECGEGLTTFSHELLDPSGDLNDNADQAEAEPWTTPLFPAGFSHSNNSDLLSFAMGGGFERSSDTWTTIFVDEDDTRDFLQFGTGILADGDSDFTTYAISSVSGQQPFLLAESPQPIRDNIPIGGTSFPVSTTSLLVAGAQANMGLLSLALVGMVAAGAAIIYKTKSKKTEQ